MNTPEFLAPAKDGHRAILTSGTAFSRLDEQADQLFYQRPRIVSHLDAQALETVQKLIGQLIIEPRPVILDLMASCDSHLPGEVNPAALIGLGMNQQELETNERLTDRLVHDLNENPELPFEDNTFDVVLNTVSVDYLTHPIDVFAEVARVLKPGGLFLVIFSNRYFPQKVTRVWADCTEHERLKLIDDFFLFTGRFEESQHFVSMGLPRPADDKYAKAGIPSDPIFAVYAEKAGLESATRKERPSAIAELVPLPAPEILEQRRDMMAETHRCPFCEGKLHKWAVTENPFTTWDHDLYVCINDTCPYLIRGWNIMFKQGNVGTSYRLVVDPNTWNSLPIPIPNLFAIKDELIEDDA